MSYRHNFLVFFVKLNDILFFLSWLFTVISNDETKVRRLQRYFTIKIFQAVSAMGRKCHSKKMYIFHYIY